MIDALKGTVTPKDWAFVGAVLFITLFLGAVFVLFVRAGQEARLEALAQDIEELEANVAHARETRDNIEDLREETAQIQALVDEFERRLPARREIPQLMGEFEALARDVGVDVELAQLSRVRDVRKETIPYTVTAYGDFHQIVNFINRLERFERYLKISELDISEQLQGICEAEFTLSTYRFLESPQVGG